MEALNDVYLSATANVQRADSVVVTIVMAFHAILEARGESPKEFGAADYERCLSVWELTATALAQPVPSLNVGVQSVLASYVIQAWTVFEVLTGDLWEMAVNVSPNVLARLDGKGGGEKDGKQINLNLLAKHDYDLRNRMGTILRSKVSFDKLSKIREAYSSAFSADGKAIADILDDPGFAVLSAVRNLLVHKAGRYDTEYLRQVKNLAMAPRGALGEQVWLTGTFVSETFERVADRTIALLKAVDDWLVAHPSEAAVKSET